MCLVNFQRVQPFGALNISLYSPIFRFFIEIARRKLYNYSDFKTWNCEFINHNSYFFLTISISQFFFFSKLLDINSQLQVKSKLRDEKLQLPFLFFIPWRKQASILWGYLDFEILKLPGEIGSS